MKILSLLLTLSSVSYAQTSVQRTYLYNDAHGRPVLTNIYEISSGPGQTNLFLESKGVKREINPDYYRNQQAEAQRGRILQEERALGQEFKERTDRQNSRLATVSLTALSAATLIIQREIDHNAKPILTSINMDEQSQHEQIRRHAEALADHDYFSAAYIEAELSSPLLTNRTNETTSWLERLPEGNIRTSALPKFATKELDHQNLLTSKILNYALEAHPQASGRGVAWVRASLYLLQAAAVAEKRGDSARAKQLINQAQTIAKFLGGRSGELGVRIEGTNATDFTFSDSTSLVGQSYAQDDADKVIQAAYNTYLNEISPDLATRTNPQAVTLSKETLEAILTELEKSAPPEQQRYVEFGKRALKRLDQFTHDPEAQQTLKTMAVLGADIAIGFWPPASLARDLHEFSTGRHWLTNEPLGYFDRGMALVGIVTAGTASTTYKAVRGVVKIAEETKDLQKSVHAADGITEVLKHMKAYNADFVKSIRAEVAAGKTVEEQRKILDQIEKKVMQRTDGMKLDADIKGFVQGKRANELISANYRRGFEKVFHEADDVTIVQLLKAPAETGEELIRLHGYTNKISQFVLFKKNIQGLTPKDVMARWNFQLKEGEILFTAPHIQKGETLLLSGVEKNKWGHGQGYVQVQLGEVYEHSYKVPTYKLPLDRNGKIDFNLPLGKEVAL